MSQLLIFVLLILAKQVIFGSSSNGRSDFEFSTKVKLALERTKDFLHKTKFPVFLPDADHVYEDKFLLAEFLVNNAFEAVVRTWHYLGIDENILRRLKAWSENSETVYVKFHSEERCTHNGFRVYEAPSMTREEIKVKTSLFFETTASHTSYTTINESTWTHAFSYQIVAYSGSQQEDVVVLFANDVTRSVITTTANPPFPPVKQRSQKVEISYLLQQLAWIGPALANSDDPTRRYKSAFAVNRTHSHCHTPRRNVDVEHALVIAGSVSNWADTVKCDLIAVTAATASHASDVTMKLNQLLEQVFVPVLPVFFAEKSDMTEDKAKAKARAPLSDEMVAFLNEEERSLKVALEGIEKVFSSNLPALFSNHEAKLGLILMHTSVLMQFLSSGISSIENLLRNQLIAALGTSLTASDFDQYMLFHNRRLFKENYAPKPFSYSVRRGDGFSPEGLLAIENSAVSHFNKRQSTSGGQPISCISRYFPSSNDSLSPSASAELVSSLPPLRMKLPLQAEGISATFGGERYLHAWLSHGFSNDQEGPGSTWIVASARQFSSFILVLGRIQSFNNFIPERAIIVRDKDVLKIPLDINSIPTAQEFRDATSSLSPEQQQFAKSFRSMQLGGTVIALLVVQIKPQLELVLNLSPGSLIKQIKLTQDLMELFIEYQIPSDMLSYTAENGDTTLGNTGNEAERIEAVRANVQAMKVVLFFFFYIVEVYFIRVMVAWF